ncbi:MAG: Tm-1-like ATP-binding domain-containing protein, partial [Treponema sp.]|nr:Tm-1-like ATP-binding domain-containing protein [Treponema sp.]
DTKCAEVQFLCERLHDARIAPLVINISVGLGESALCADIGREQVFAAAGLAWQDIRDRPKGELIRLMQEAVKVTVRDLHERGKINGIIAIGGVQNTSIAVGAMQMLPIGFPKVVATTIASGNRPFKSVVGNKDIVVIPSIADFSGLNVITRAIIANAAAALAGLVTFAGRPLEKSGKVVVGISLMGITNVAAAFIVDELSKAGIETIGFHATGAGGSIMEQLAEEKIIDAILDLTTHEITAEYFGGGFSHGAFERLLKPLKSGIPVLVCTGGLDFVDYSIADCPLDLSKRKYNKHNAELAHIKITVNEARDIGKIFAERLAWGKNGVTVLIPKNGMRLNTRPGESLYDGDVDRALVDSIKKYAPDTAVIKEIDGNINDESWARSAAREMLKILISSGFPVNG